MNGIMELQSLIIYFSKNRDLFNGSIDEFKKANAEILYPIANELLLNYSKSLEHMITSMLQNAQSQNLYASTILYRAHIEHFFKAFYIFSKTLIDKSDDVAEKFKKHYFISEVLSEQAGFLEMETIQSGLNEKTDFLEFLIKKIPALKGFNKTNQREISAAIKQFSLKEIIKYFHENITNNPKIADSKVITQMLPEYSKVSSFTHGGPYAFTQITNHKDKETTNSELRRIIEISILSYNIINKGVFMTYYPNVQIVTALETIEKIT